MSEEHLQASAAYTEEEISLLKKYVTDGLTDIEIAEKLGRSRVSIAMKRAKLGIVKNKIRPPKDNLSREERKLIEIKRYKNSPLYNRLDGILTSDEKLFFDEEMELYLEGLEEIDRRDLENLNGLIMELVIQHRLLRKEKDAKELGKEVDINLEYDNSVKRFEKLSNMLKFSRRQRLEESKDNRRVNICDLVEAFEKKENKEKINKQIHLQDEEIRDFKLRISNSENSSIFGDDSLENLEKKSNENM